MEEEGRERNSDIRIPVANNNSITAMSRMQHRSWYFMLPVLFVRKVPKEMPVWSEKKSFWGEALLRGNELFSFAKGFSFNIS